MEIPMNAISKMLRFRWRILSFACTCCLAVATLALAILGSDAAAKPKGVPKGNPECPYYAVCVKYCVTTGSSKQACLRVCDDYLIKCLNGGGGRIDPGAGGLGSLPPGGVGNFPVAPGHPISVRPPVTAYPISGPVKVAPVGISSRNAVRSVGLKTRANTKLRSQSKRRR